MKIRIIPECVHCIFDVNESICYVMICYLTLLIKYARKTNAELILFLIKR